MPDSWRTVREFISSMFRDMHAERDHLVAVVVCRLHERIELMKPGLLGTGLCRGIIMAVIGA